MRKHVKGNVSWVGYIDWELESFHGDDYSIMNGSSQNAYLIEEEKTVLIDTVWTPHRFDFVENLKKEIDLKKIDFIVAHHGECDHSRSLTAASLPEQLLRICPMTGAARSAASARICLRRFNR